MVDDVQNKHLIFPKVGNVFKVYGCDKLVVDQCLPGRFLFRRMYFVRRIWRIPMFLEDGLNRFFVEVKIKLTLEHAGDHTRAVFRVFFFHRQDDINHILRSARSSRPPLLLLALLRSLRIFCFFAHFFK